MALTSWKAFRFFDATQLPGPPDAFDVQNETSCVVAGKTNVFVGGRDGTVTLLNDSFKRTQSFRAHNLGSVRYIAPVQDTTLLVTLSEDIPHEPELKAWALDKPDKRTGAPRCLSTVAVQNGRRQFPVSAFTVLPDLSQVAVGFANGSVTILRGDFIHDRGTKQRTVLDGDEPITGLEFREGATTVLYIATTNRILTLVISGKGQGQPARTLDEHGCAVGCMIKHGETKDIVIARHDAVYAYNARGRGASFAFDGPKRLVGTLRDYLVLVSPPQNNARSVPARSFGTARADDLYTTTTLTILDPDLKIIVHSEALSSEISHLVTAWGFIFLITQDGKVLRYKEKAFPQKLEMLYQRDHYVLAINLAQRQGLDPAQQNTIFRRYGDYLYQKGDFDTAMQQYLRAIDSTEPSQIIRKFLDNQRIRNLIEYLEELHEHGKASPDHTTLLLNCYAKLKDVDKLEAFIKQPGDLRFDLSTAIVMCRQGGYSDQAAFLARKHNEHGLVVDILIEDLKRYAEAVAYIVRLEPDLAYQNGVKYATVLLEHMAAEETNFLIDYFTGSYRPKKDALVEQEAPAAQFGYASRATTAVQNLASLIPLPYMNMDIMRSSKPHDNEQQLVSQVVETTADNDFIPYDVPKPRKAFACFIDHPDRFITFLEACIAHPNIRSEDKSDLYDTLFEMYLATARRCPESERSIWTGKAEALISQDNVPMSPSSILLLSNLASFTTGSVLVREQQGLYFDIFRAYTSAQDTAGAIKALRKYGPEEPQLYPAALAYFSSSPEVLAEARPELQTVLAKIDRDGLMAPLQVIQALSQSDVADMGLIKEYLSKTVEREQSEITSNKKLVSLYRTDTTIKKQELADLRTKPTSFSATRCATCGTPLDLPVVHFLCKHSFHQRCVTSGLSLHEDEDELECPICATSNATIRTIRGAQIDSASRSELFIDAISRSKDRFATVGEWFGRGVMDIKLE